MNKYGFNFLGKSFNNLGVGDHVLQSSSVAPNSPLRADVPKRAPLTFKMAEKNPDKSYGWYKAQHFSDYIERVVGEIINIKFISINITTISTLIR